MPRKSTTIPRVCEQCGRGFEVYPFRLKQGHVRFCSRACHQVFQKAHATAKNFWTNIQKVGECWLWVGTSWRRGYGRLQYNGKSSCAHRVAYELARGPIPDGLLVCHKCDTPACINPDHLFLGTDFDNVHDAMEKGRFALGVGRFSGENRPNAKLNNQEVLEIRALAASGWSNKDIRQRFGVSRTCIDEIIKRKTWMHI